MKILITDNSSMNQKGNSYCTNTLNGLFVTDLIACNNKVSYFQFAKATNDSISAFDLERNGVKCYPQPIKKSKVFNYLNAYLRVIPLILKYDFVYFYYPSSFKYAPFLCWLFRKKYGLYVRGMIGINDKVSIWNYKKSFVIFTVSDFFTKMINKKTNKITAHTIKPMIPFTDKDIVRDRSYQIKQKYNILFLGRIAKDKGIEELLNATSILKNEEALFELNIVGSGEFIEEARQIASNLKINDVVKFLGPVYDTEKIKEYYINADLYVLPTYHEGFPRTLYEAMIFGIPIITTLVGGISSLMKDNYNCKSIEPKSTDSVLEGLKFAFGNYDKMIDFAKNGTNTISEIVDSKRLTHAQHLNKILKE